MRPDAPPTTAEDAPPDAEPSASDAPEEARSASGGTGPGGLFSWPSGAMTVALVGLFVLAAFYTLYLASGFFLPVVLAVLLNFLLGPLVRFFVRLHLPTPAAAAVVVLGFVGTLGLGLYYLSGPASGWIERAPETLRQVEFQLRGVWETVEDVREATEGVNGTADEEGAAGRSVEVRPTASTTLMDQTLEAVAGTFVMLFLLYFLLASGDLFLRKLVHVLPLFRRKRIAVEIAQGIERDLSRYLFTYGLINTALGATVALVLWGLGLPNPVLWGLMAGILNFVPYLGPLVGVTIVGLVAFVSLDDTGTALLAPALYFAINALEGNLITPMVMGHRLQLNPVAIFVSLIFWGWLWGIAGALIAVPLLVAFKIVCENVATLSPLGEFLGQ